MRLVYTAIFLAFIAINLTYSSTITGKVIDLKDKSPLPNATIKIYNLKDSTLLKGLYSDKDGAFNINLEKQIKDCYITISYIGYENFNTEAIRLENAENQINIGAINLKANSSTEEILVTADKEAIVYSAGKKVVNIDESIVSQGGNAIDVLRTLPTLNVDAEGNISMRGSGSVNIMIDNKPVSMMGDVNQILQSIPSSLLDKVEIVTNPGAKYDAQGQSGIVNIILKKKRDEGVNGAINSTIGNIDMYNLSSNFNYKIDNMNFFINLDGGSNRHLRQLRVDSRFFDEDKTLTSEIFKTGPQEWNSFNGGGRAGLDYTLDEFNSFTISFDHRYNNSKNGNPFFNNVSTYQNGNVFNSYFMNDASTSFPTQSSYAGINYIHNFGEKGFDLTIDGYYFSSLFDLRSNFALIQTDKDKNPIENVFYNNYKTSTIGSSDSYQFQGDLIYPMKDGAKIETGAKAYLQGMTSKFLFDRYNPTLATYYKDEVQSSQASHQDNIYSLYFIFSDKVFDIYYQAGLRLEHTSNEMYDFLQNGNDSANFKRDFTNIFPNLSFSHSLTELSSLQLSYSRRINRPQAQLLNPYLDKTDSLYWKSGNPQLLPEFTNSFEFGYLENTQYGVFSAEIFYTNTNQLMNPRYRENITSSVIYEKPINIGTAQSYGFTFGSNLDILKEWKLNLELSTFYQQTDGNYNSVSYNQESLGWSSKIVSNIILPDNLLIQIYANYNSPVVITQGSRFEFMLANLAVRKEFFDRKLSLSMNWVDFLNTAQFGGNVTGYNFEADLYNRRDFNYISLTMSYKINDTQSNKRRNSPNGGGGFGDTGGSI